MPRKSPAEGAQGAVASKPLPSSTNTGKTPQKASGAPYRLKSPRPLEVDEQAAVFQHAALRARTDPRWGMLFAIPNGKAASSIREAVNAKRTGLKRGVPDMFLPVPVGEWHGLFLELKRYGRTKSDLKPEQVSWIVKLQAAGYQTVVAFGWKEAVAEIAGYLGDGDG
jgi:hypothetical protein